MKIKSKELKDIVWLSKKENNFNWLAPCISNTCCHESDYYAHIEITNTKFTGNNKENQKLLNLKWLIFVCENHKKRFDNFISEKELYKAPSEKELSESFLKLFEITNMTAFEIGYWLYEKCYPTDFFSKKLEKEISMYLKIWTFLKKYYKQGDELYLYKITHIWKNDEWVEYKN